MRYFFEFAVGRDCFFGKHQPRDDLWSQRRIDDDDDRSVGGMTPLVIMSAPNGARRTKADHPRLPITPEEMAAEAVRVAEAGATLLHLHVRDDDGRHSLDPGRYRQVIDAVKAAIGDRMVIQITTEAVGRYDPAAQMQVVRQLEPRSVSLALRELIPNDSDADIATGADFFAWLRERRIAPHFILYSLEDVRRFEAFRTRGVIPQQKPFALFVLGRYVEPTEVRANDLLPFLAEHDQNNPWSICAFGPVESAAAMTSVTLGGHVRVGFENNLWRADGELADSNADLVAQAVTGAGLIGRKVADIDETQALINETAA